MASLKRLLYIFIPVFAILLMSHNANALSFGNAVNNAIVPSRTFVNVENAENTTYNLPASNVYRDNYGLIVQIPTNTIRVNNIRIGFYDPVPNKYLFNISYRFCPANPDDLKSWIGFAGSSKNAIISQKWIINGSCISGDVLSFGSNTATTDEKYRVDLGLGGNSGIQIGNIYAGGSIVFNSASFITLTDDADYSSVLNAIKNNTDDIKSKLDDLEEAAQTQQEAAEKDLQGVENIENQSADDYEMESANMSSLFTQFGGFITAVSGAHVGDCNIPANLNHMDLGILNMCANPVPDYAQVAVSIIVCMLIAPYLLNIIKRIIGIADKVREV